MSTLLVETPPRDARNLGAVNMGALIASRRLQADRAMWWEPADVAEYERIAFNVFYPMHVFNALAFLRKHGIPALKSDRRGKPEVWFGGQGSSLRCLGQIADHVFRGEIDAAQPLDETSPEIGERNATMELTRGCKHRCTFCEYAWVHGGRYREKSLDATIRQLEWCADRGYRNVNLMTANLCGYSHIGDVLGYTAQRNINILSSDACLMDLANIPDLKLLRGKSFKLGVESFNEDTRYSVGKRISDAYLRDAIDELLAVSNHLHFYLIYGLPGEDYEPWFEWLEYIKTVRDRWVSTGTDLLGDASRTVSKPVRIEFSITNFEPCVGTPLANTPTVDFNEKAAFLQRWSEALIRLGYHKGTSISHANCGGRFGRRECVYDVLMTLKRGGPEITGALLESFPRGITRTPDAKKCEAFLAAVGTTTHATPPNPNAGIARIDDSGVCGGIYRSGGFDGLKGLGIADKLERMTDEQAVEV